MTQEASSVLQAWLEDEARVRERVAAGAGSEPISRAELLRLPGIAVFEAMFEGRLPGAPIAKTLDFLPVKIEPELVTRSNRSSQ